MSRGIRCVKCKASAPYVLLFEKHSMGGIQFEQDDNGRVSAGYMIEPSSIDGVDAHCTLCDHVWTLRSVGSIDDVKRRYDHP